jgi:tetratricopeptide (TPR) repeat protein
VRRVTRLSEQSELDRDLARANFGRALRAVDAMLRSVGAERLDHVPGADPLRIELLGAAGELYGELARERPDDASLAALAAESGLARARLIHRNGDSAAAIAAVHALLGGLQHAAAQADFRTRTLRAQAWLLLSTWSAMSDEAVALHAATLGELHDLQRERPADVGVQALLADALTSPILDNRRRGDRESAAAILEFSEELARDCAAASDSLPAQEALARVLAVKGAVLAREGRWEEALVALEEALVLRRGVLARVPEGEDERYAVCESSATLANVLMLLGRYASSLELLEFAAGEIECLLVNFPDVREFQARAADVMLNLGALHGRMKHAPEARVALERAAELHTQLLERAPEDAGLHQALGTTLLNLCDLQLSAGDPEGALETCARSLRQFERALELLPDDPDFGAWRAPERSTRAKILLALGRTAEAAEALADAPSLAGHQRERALHCLKRLVVVLRAAREEGDAETIERCDAAARLALQRAEERGDLEGDPTLRTIGELLESR